MDALAAAKKRQYIRRKKRVRILVTLLLVLTIIAVWTLVIVIGVRLFGSGKPSESGETTPVSVLETTPAPPVTSAPPVDVQTEIIRLPKADLAKGDLILVSTLLQRAYSFPEGDDGLIALYGNKSASYRISSTALRLKKTVVEALNEMFDAYFAETGNRDYQITQAYRT